MSSVPNQAIVSNSYDGHIVGAVLEKAANLTQHHRSNFAKVVVDLEFRGASADKLGKNVMHCGCHEYLPNALKERSSAPAPVGRSDIGHLRKR